MFFFVDTFSYHGHSWRYSSCHNIKNYPGWSIGRFSRCQIELRIVESFESLLANDIVERFHIKILIVTVSNIVMSFIVVNEK